MMDWFAIDPAKLLPMGLTALLAFIGLVTLTRLGGIRSFSKMSGFDFAVTVGIGSIFASIVMAKDPSVGQGLIALAFIFAIQLSVAVLRVNYKFVKDLTDNKARLIMVGDEIQHDQLKKSRITETDLYAKLREANVFHRNQIIAVVAETTGDVSVLHSEGDTEITAEYFQGVIGAERLISA